MIKENVKKMEQDQQLAGQPNIQRTRLTENLRVALG